VLKELKYKVLGNPWFVLTEDYFLPFTLRVLYSGHPELDKMVHLTGVHPDTLMYIVAPRGFVTDLASIPDALRPILHPDGPWALAACMHDLLYQRKASTVPYPDTPAGNLSRTTDKTFADLMFLRIMEASNVDKFIRESFYKAVKEFGWPSYADDNLSLVYQTPVKETLQYNRNYLFFREAGEERLPAIPDGERVELVHGTPVNLGYQNIKRPFIALLD